MCSKPLWCKRKWGGQTEAYLFLMSLFHSTQRITLVWCWIFCYCADTSLQREGYERSTEQPQGRDHLHKLLRCPVRSAAQPLWRASRSLPHPWNCSLCPKGMLKWGLVLLWKWLVIFCTGAFTTVLWGLYFSLHSCFSLFPPFLSLRVVLKARVSTIAIEIKLYLPGFCCLFWGHI